MFKSLNRRAKIFIIIVFAVVLVILVFLGINSFKRKGSVYGFFSGIQWNNPYTVRTANPFEGLKLNPFKK